MPPAARVTDMHVCPMVTGVVPHVGGPILPPAVPRYSSGFFPQPVSLTCLLASGRPT